MLTENEFKEMLTLLREIHAHLCAPVKTAAPRELKYHKYSKLLPTLMEQGQRYIYETITELLKPHGVTPTAVGLQNTMSRLARDGVLVRVRHGIYKLPELA